MSEAEQIQSAVQKLRDMVTEIWPVWEQIDECLLRNESRLPHGDVAWWNEPNDEVRRAISALSSALHTARARYADLRLEEGQ